MAYRQYFADASVGSINISGGLVFSNLLLYYYKTVGLMTLGTMNRGRKLPVILFVPALYSTDAIST